MPKRTERKRWRLLKLWEREPNCHWCGRPVVIVFRPAGVGMREQPVKANEATMDHLYSRLNGQRGTTPYGEEATVLSCWECNNRRSHEECASLPLDELRMRASGSKRELRGGIGG